MSEFVKAKTVFARLARHGCMFQGQDADGVTTWRARNGTIFLLVPPDHGHYLAARTNHEQPGELFEKGYIDELFERLEKFAG